MDDFYERLFNRRETSYLALLRPTHRWGDCKPAGLNGQLITIPIGPPSSQQPVKLDAGESQRVGPELLPIAKLWGRS